MTWLDAGAVVVVALAAIAGFRRGLVVGAASLGGLAGGAYAGAKLAPHVLGERAFYPPLVALGGAVVGAGIGQMLAVLAGRSLRRLLRLGLLRAFDSVTGALLGAASGFAFVWVVAAVLLYAPGDGELRRAVQRSAIAGTLTSALPPAEVIGVLARIDPFSALAGPEANVAPPDAGVLRDPDIRLAARSVVRMTGNACGLGIEGSGWVAAPGLVVTNAHVVGGVARPSVATEGAGRTPAASSPSTRATTWPSSPCRACARDRSPWPARAPGSRWPCSATPRTGRSTGSRAGSG